MSITLSRANNTSTTYTTIELASLITSLEASNSQHVVANGIAFYRISALRMLILDVDALHNRRLVETYAIQHDATTPYNVSFTSNNITFNLDDALDAVGHSNLTPVASLSSIFVAVYEVASSSQYLEASNLVKDQGTYALAPAEIKTLVGGTQIELVETSDAVTVSMLPLTINYPLPNYGEAPLPTSTYAYVHLLASAYIYV